MKSAIIFAISAVAIMISSALAHRHEAIAKSEEFQTAGHNPNRPARHQYRRRLDSETEYPTYSPTAGTDTPTTYAPTGGDDDGEVTWSTYAPTGGEPDDPEYATAAPTGLIVPTVMPTEAGLVESIAVTAMTTTTSTVTTSVTTTMATTTPRMATTATSTEVADAGVPVCPTALVKSITIDSKATLHYALVPSNPPGSDNGILCGRLDAQNGNGWIGLAVSTNGDMVGSEAILGIPEDGSVMKYDLAGKGPGGVTPMSADKQTLRDVSIREEDDDGMTVMEFTKLLVEDTEIPILEEGANTFLHARGGSSLGYHYNGHLSFEVDFTTVAPAIGNADQINANNDVNGLEVRLSNSAEGTTNYASSGSFSNAVSLVSLSIMPVLLLMVY